MFVDVRYWVILTVHKCCGHLLHVACLASFRRLDPSSDWGMAVKRHTFIHAQYLSFCFLLESLQEASFWQVSVSCNQLRRWVKDRKTELQSRMKLIFKTNFSWHTFIWYVKKYILWNSSETWQDSTTCFSREYYWNRKIVTPSRPDSWAPERGKKYKLGFCEASKNALPPSPILLKDSWIIFLCADPYVNACNKTTETFLS